MRTEPRRRVMRLLALPISVLAAATALTACGGSSGSASTSGNGSSTGSAVVNWAATSDLINWDPVVVGSTGGTQFLAPIYEPLFTLDAQGTPQPALATGWKYNAAGDQITITLRPGLTFQDGSAIKADAVAYNIKRIQTQKNSALKALYRDVKSTTVLDDLHVRLNLTETDYQIPYILANRAGLLASEKAAEANVSGLNTNSPVGAGPFKVVKLVPESSVTLEKWDGYWDAKNIHIDRINIKIGVDPSTVLSGVQTGVYNFVNNFPAQSVALAQKSGLKVTTDVARGWGAYFLSLNYNKAPFNNPKVVQAVQYAINRQQFADQLSFGLGTPSAQPFPPTSPAFNASVNSEYTFDPAKAKQLLAEAGYQPGALSLEVDALQGQFNSATEILQQQLKAVGINLKIKLENFTQYFNDYYGKTDVFTLYGYVGRDSKLGALDDQFGPGGILNLSSPLSSSQYAEARKKVLSAPLDSPDYKTVLQAATKAGVENGSNITLFTQPQPYVTTKEFSDFPVIDGTFRWNGVTIGDS